MYTPPPPFYLLTQGYFLKSKPACVDIVDCGISVDFNDMEVRGMPSPVGTPMPPRALKRVTDKTAGAALSSIQKQSVG